MFTGTFNLRTVVRLPSVLESQNIIGFGITNGANNDKRQFCFLCKKAQNFVRSSCTCIKKKKKSSDHHIRHV